MPFKRKFVRRKFSRKTGFRKYGRRYGRKFGKKYRKPRRIINMIPNALSVKLRYTAPYTTTQISTNSLYQDSYQYRLGGAAFPLYGQTSAQYQPMYYGYYATQYMSYRCHGVKIMQVYTNMSPNTVMVMQSLTNAAGVFTTATDQKVIQENRYTKVRTLPPQGSGSNRCIIKRYVKNYALAGMSKLKYNIADSTASATNGVPNDDQFLQSFFQSMDTSAAASLHVQTYITYYVRFYNRKAVTSISTVPSPDVPPEVQDDNPDIPGPDGYIQPDVIGPTGPQGPTGPTGPPGDGEDLDLIPDYYSDYYAKRISELEDDLKNINIRYAQLIPRKPPE